MCNCFSSSILPHTPLKPRPTRPPTCHPRAKGGGFLTDHFPQATKACWDFEGVNCCSRHLPGVRFAGLIHPGLIGTAPSAELLAMWNAREAALVAEEGTPAEKTLCSVLATRPLATLPNPKGAMLGKHGHCAAKAGKDATWDRIAAEAARTVPGRENGGNCDIKNLSRGSVLYLPVFVQGANLSMGDMHFSQGDGEVSPAPEHPLCLLVRLASVCACSARALTPASSASAPSALQVSFCGAIEMSGFLELKCTVIKGGMKMLPVVGPSPLCVNPIFELGPLEPRYSEWLVFEGISVDEQGRQHFLDATLAYKRAVLNAIKYLANFGYTEEQVYLLLSCCPCEGRISGIVDVPNAVATLAIPLAIFDRDVRPKAGAVLEALAKGIRVAQIGRDLAHESATAVPPAPLDPRLAAAEASAAEAPESASKRRRS